MAGNSPSDEDKDLFRQHMQAVKPLKKAQEKISSTPKSPEVPKITRNKRKTETPPISINNPLSDYLVEEVQAETCLSYKHPDLANQRFSALRKGQIPWESRLDLHGLRPEQARQELCQFIPKQQQEGRRCLLLIHGKGGYQGAAPVLKNLINRWLPQFSEVLGFHSALPKDGGTGAVYILLKKQVGLNPWT